MGNKIQSVYAFFLLFLTTASYAQQNICVFDPLGTQGDSYSFMKDYALAAREWGGEVVLKPYTDDQRLNDDFKSGKCDGLSTMGIRAREFNNFTGAIDSPGGVPNDASAKTVLSLMANPKLASSMVNHDTEVVGISALGSAYIVSNNRKITKISEIYGKRFGILEFDKAQRYIIERVGTIPVPLTILTMGKKFNNGQVDMIDMPAMAFQALELNKGMGVDGVIIKFPVAYMTNQIIIHQSRFPVGFGQNSRSWVAGQLERQFKTVKDIEQHIDTHYWMNIPANDMLAYGRLFRDVRIKLTSEGIYNARMMSILKKVRCQQDTRNYECSGLDASE